MTMIFACIGAVGAVVAGLWGANWYSTKRVSHLTFPGFRHKLKILRQDPSLLEELKGQYKLISVGGVKGHYSAFVIDHDGKGWDFLKGVDRDAIITDAEWLADELGVPFENTFDYGPPRMPRDRAESIRRPPPKVKPWKGSYLH